MNDDYQEINQALVRVYNGILWVEEHELRKSMFRDLTIKEMHAIDAITRLFRRLRKNCMSHQAR